ncbi:hypothetical protein [Kribbella karoonensis]|uniref:DUF2550 family protein n=1 Tax=Kribbella karoonensis TaxID=324851 RepID=A0ABN2DU79_9ACTN
MLTSAGFVFTAGGIGVETLGLVLFGVGILLAGLFRAWWWATVCATSQLVDDGKHLVWMYRGDRREAVAWADLRHVLLQRWARRLVWAIGPKSGGPFPFVLVDSRADPPPSGFRLFAEVMIIDGAQLRAADQALADACLRHGVTYHGPDSGW